MLTDVATGRSRGAAFVTFADEASVEKALRFDSTAYGGRTLRVQRRVEHKGKGNGGQKGKQGSKGKAKGKAKCQSSVIVKGLDPNTTEADLCGAFADCGNGPTRVNILV